MSNAQRQSPETALYPPVKSCLEAMGYEVKAEVGAADVVAVKGDAPPLIVELKTGFSLTLLQQAVERQALTDSVYVAVPRWKGKAGWRAFKGNLSLCKRLGIGVMTVRDDGTVEIHEDPREFRPRKSKVKLARLMAEFARREGDPNLGGTRGQRVTAYRQDAQKCAAFLRANGPAKAADVARETGVERARLIMAANHYGWFERVERGIYALIASDTSSQADADKPE